jgi:hypothetical protein
VPFSQLLARSDKNKDGVITPDEYGTVNVLRSAGQYIGNRDGILTEEKWRGWNEHVKGPTVLYSVKNGGILTAFDAKSGEVTKVGRIEGALGGYSSSPVMAEGRIYFASEEGKGAVVRAGREWTVIQVNDLAEGMYATPALSEGKIFLRTAEALYCFGGQ